MPTYGAMTVPLIFSSDHLCLTTNRQRCWLAACMDQSAQQLSYDDLLFAPSNKIHRLSNDGIRDEFQIAENSLADDTDAAGGKY